MYTLIAVFVHFNRFSDLKINFHTNPYHEFGFQYAVVILGALYFHQLEAPFVNKKKTETCQRPVRETLDPNHDRCPRALCAERDVCQRLKKKNSPGGFFVTFMNQSPGSELRSIC